MFQGKRRGKGYHRLKSFWTVKKKSAKSSRQSLRGIRDHSSSTDFFFRNPFDQSTCFRAESRQMKDGENMSKALSGLRVWISAKTAKYFTATFYPFQLMQSPPPISFTSVCFFRGSYFPFFLFFLRVFIGQNRKYVELYGKWPRSIRWFRRPLEIHPPKPDCPSFCPSFFIWSRYFLDAWKSWI